MLREEKTRDLAREDDETGTGRQMRTIDPNRKKDDRYASSEHVGRESAASSVAFVSTQDENAARRVRRSLKDIPVPETFVSVLQEKGQEEKKDTGKRSDKKEEGTGNDRKAVERDPATGADDNMRTQGFRSSQNIIETLSSVEAPRPGSMASANEEDLIVHVIYDPEAPAGTDDDRRAKRAKARAEKKRAGEAAKSGKAERKKKKKKRKKRSKRKTPIWQIIMLIIGLSLLAYPIIADRISAWQADQAITSYTMNLEDDPATINRLLDEAQAYNDRLSGTPSTYQGEIPPQDQLIVAGDVPFAWIEFPSLAEKLPIYHGTDENSLQAGVGHLERTSMPIGGRSTHCVLTGHSGMPGNRMFDDIDHLSVGDIFMIHVLNQDLAYKVISSEVVWPDEVDSLVIQPGRDLVTLITCTPYGINDHRLLVHAERTDYDEALSLPSNNMALIFNQRTLPFILAICLTVLFFTMLTINRRRRYPLELGVDKAWNGLSDYTDDKRRFIGYDRSD